MLNLLSPGSFRAARSNTHIGRSAQTDRWVKLLFDQRLRAEARGRQVGRTSDGDLDGLLDVRLAGPGEPKDPDEVFARMRWGGLFACVDPDPKRLNRALEAFDDRNGFVIEQGFDELWGGPLGLRLPGITPRAYCFTARKTHLVQPGEASDRFTYDVTLRADDAAPHGYCVRKRLPEAAALAERLGQRFPALTPARALARARKLVDEVFPVFLTREAGALDVLQKTLPPAFRSRVPRLLRVEKDAKGRVVCLEMNWLRNGGGGVSQLEFALQAAELLAVLHDHARVMHLDLRPDNLVITEDGVGFVDFGSAVMIGEDLAANPALDRLFAETMQTSQIQRVLGDMIDRGEVTNQALVAARGRADPGVDTFYLALQLNQPHANPELEQLVEYNPLGKTAEALEALTASVLRPKGPGRDQYQTAADVRRGVSRVAQHFAG